MASKSRPRETGSRKSPWVRRLKRAFLLLATLFLLGTSVLICLYLVDLNRAKADMADMHINLDQVAKPVTKIMSADGELLYSVSAENRIPLRLSEIPKMVQNAVLAAEDKRFYNHSAVDLTSMLRVVFVDAKQGRLAQGGSTITMQLVKLLYNGNSRTFRRKMNDIAYATAMEENLTKDQILELYLNKVFFGEGAFGIGEAAKVYFDKRVDQLTLGEAAMLARCIRRPSSENPIRDLKVALDNRDVVLDIMLDENMITKSQYDEAIHEKPRISAKPEGEGVYVRPGAQYYVDSVLKFIEKDQGLNLMSGGYTIESTMNWKLQEDTIAAVREGVAEHGGRDYRVNQGAFMVMDSDGWILSEVGGLNYRQHRTNLITQTLLQPGSGFKPILYATALKDGVINMDSRLSNAPITKVDSVGKVWHPGNSSRSEDAPSYSLRTALARSVNLCAIHTIEDTGPENVVEAAHDIFGFRSKLEPYEPLALGASGVLPIEMAEAYSVFMLRGDRVRPQPVKRILGADGSVIKQYEPERFVGVLDPTICDDMDQLLRAVVEEGTGQAAMVVPDSRGKTGTTNKAKDAWFTGYTDGVLGVGWVGHEHKEKGQWVQDRMGEEAYGGTITAKIWAKVMGEARQRFGKRPEDRANPATAENSKQKVHPDVLKDKTVPPPGGDGTGDALTDGATVAAAAKGQGQKQTGDSGDGVDSTDSMDSTTDSSTTDIDKDTKTDPSQPPPKSHLQTRNSPRIRTRKPSDQDTVTVEICADSGLRANRYCPETVTRTYIRGQEPKKVCTIHGPGH